jgi:aminomethyltransferase
MTETLSATPLATWHQAAGAVMAPFAGYEMPIHYGSIVDEHHACRTRGVLFDVSHMGRLRFEGEGAVEFLDSVLTRRVIDLPVGAVRYSLVCNDAGFVLDDVLISHVETPSGGRYYLLVVNASNRAKIIQWLTPLLADFPFVTMTDRTELTAMIAVQGPAVMEATSKLFKFDPQRLKYYRSVVTEQMGKPVIISRTGYTGEDGIELIVRAEEAVRVWENLLLAGRDSGFIAAGLGSRDTLRLEAAMPLYGHELDETIDPITAGLAFACNMENRTFHGSAAIMNVIQDGPKLARVGIVPEGRRPIREGCDIYDRDGKFVGRVTSGAPSPTLGHPIAMGYVTACTSHVETPVEVDIRGKREAARVVSLPFYSRPRKAKSQ